MRLLLAAGGRDEATAVERLLHLRAALTVTTSGPEALTWLDRAAFDVLLFDLRLGEASLLRVLRTVHAWGERAPVILLGDPEDEELTVRGLRQGARDYLLRGSLTAEALLRAVRYATDRARADRALRQARDRHRALFERVQAGAFRLSLEGRLLECNAALAAMLGYDDPTAAAAAGVLPLAPTEPPAPGRGADRLLELCEGGGRRWRLQRRDGGELVVTVQAFLLDGANGAPGAVEGTVLAATGEAGGDGGQALALARLGRSLAGVVHDLNNLLTTTLGYANLLTADLHFDGPPRQRAEEIRKSVLRAREMLSHLLATPGRQDGGAPGGDILELAPALEDLRTSLLASAGGGIELVYDLAPATPRVRMDCLELERVVTNLVLNARDAMPAGGGVVIGTRGAAVAAVGGEAGIPAGLPPGRYAVITIRDSGVGMDLETQGRIFEPFFTTKSGGGGTGLGLVSVSDLVHRRRGGIAVHSEPGRGTEVEVWLPAAESA